MREVQEEIGVSCAITQIQGVYHKPNQDELVLMFLANITNDEPKLSDEVADIKYFALDRLPENTALSKNND